jgi:hypothetical protein
MTHPVDLLNKESTVNRQPFSLAAVWIKICPGFGFLLNGAITPFVYETCTLG